MPSAHAIAKGLAAGHTAEKPGYWLHICGTGMLQWVRIRITCPLCLFPTDKPGLQRDRRENRLGQPPYPDEKYDDINDIAKVLSMPDEAIHRNVDKVVLAANSAAVKTAIIGPPCIYGPGRGAVNTRSIQVYDMVKFSMKKGL